MIMTAVAIPLLLNIACLKGTSVYNAITAIRPNIPACCCDILFCLDNPRCRGSRLVVARGHTLRQIPKARTNNAGATGIRIFQNSRIPVCGRKIRKLRIAAPINHTIN
jgi:hypothetical protein